MVTDPCCMERVSHAGLELLACFLEVTSCLVLKILHSLVAVVPGRDLCESSWSSVLARSGESDLILPITGISEVRPILKVFAFQPLVRR